MKNLVTISCIGIFFFFIISCSKNSGSSPPTVPAIVGNWVEDSSKDIETKNSVVTFIERQPSPDGSHYFLKSGGTGTYYEPPFQTYAGVTVNIKYTVAGNTLSLIYPTYQADGSTFDPRTDQWAILSVTAHNLAIKYTDSTTNANGTGNSLDQYLYLSK